MKNKEEVSRLYCAAMRILYPCDPLETRKPDEVYSDEYSAAREAGLSVGLFSYEDFLTGSFRCRPALEPGEQVLYRGWMMTPEEYQSLANEIGERSGSLLVTPEQYRLCHHLPEWNPALQKFTAETQIFPAGSDYAAGLADTRWPAYFVKDYVKSNSSGRGSLAANPNEIADIVAAIEKYRGHVEGGVCVRRGEIYLPDSEKRYFVVHGRVCARDEVLPEIVNQAAKLIESCFFSVDVALRNDQEWRIIELGDGQVSDRKMWTVEEFIPILTSLSTL